MRNRARANSALGPLPDVLVDKPDEIAKSFIQVD